MAKSYFAPIFRRLASAVERNQQTFYRQSDPLGKSCWTGDHKVVQIVSSRQLKHAIDEAHCAPCFLGHRADHLCGGGRALMGVMLVAIGVLILTGLDKRIETLLVEASPAWLTELTTRF